MIASTAKHVTELFYYLFCKNNATLRREIGVFYAADAAFRSGVSFRWRYSFTSTEFALGRTRHARCEAIRECAMCEKHGAKSRNTLRRQSCGTQ
jgi:hypothetical protein